MERRKEIFYLMTHSIHFMYGYGEGRLSKRGNTLTPDGLLAAMVLLYVPSEKHTTAFVTPVVEHCLEREIAQWTQHTMSGRSTTELHLAPNRWMDGWMHGWTNR